VEPKKSQKRKSDEQALRDVEQEMAKPRLAKSVRDAAHADAAKVALLTNEPSMELIVACQNTSCQRSFEVTSPGLRSHYSYVDDVPTQAACPYCDVESRIQWPQWVRFKVIRRDRKQRDPV
jgi:hypothetical protein